MSPTPTRRDGNDPNGYMQLDLGSVRPIHKVMVYNRVAACTTRIIGTSLVVSNGTHNIYSQPISVAHDVHTFDLTCGAYTGVPAAADIVPKPCSDFCIQP